MTEKTRYTDEELEEFRAIINEKLELAYRDYNQMMRQLMNLDGNDVDDTSPTYKVLEEGSATQSKEELMQLSDIIRKSYRDNGIKVSDICLKMFERESACVLNVIIEHLARHFYEL